MPPRTRAPQPADVTAVLVAHDGAAWLPEALAALRASTVQPRTVVCVDTGSADASPELLREAYGEVLTLPATTGYGEAVAAALAGAPPTEWIWLLHDDAAPEPTALQSLLAHAEVSPSAALLGPKVRDWADPRVLVEVGLSTDAAGHRHTGLERREWDQGQHDAVRDVLAVGTAGALIRRDVWDELGGLDPALPVYRDDLDLGWRVNAAGHRVVVVPAARIRHARAATTGRRELGAASGRPTGIDRRHALFVLLAHAAGARILLTLPRLVLAGLLRALGFLLTRQVLSARDEVAALAAVLGHPMRLHAARRRRAATRQVPARALRPLLASRTGRLRARAEALGDWLAGGEPPGTNPLGALGDVGPDDELAALAPARGDGALRRLLVRPGVLLTLALVLLAVVAERSVLAVHGGRLFGGRLLPVPGGARDLWSTYADSWHPTSVGSPAEAHPLVGALAAVSTLLLGKPWLAVDLLLLASVPIAAAVAYLAAGRLSGNPVLRAWAAATWALLPVATGAVADGRLDVAALQVALPLLLLGGARLLQTTPYDGGWRRAWALGLGLAVAASFAPLLWPAAAALLVAGAALTGSARRLLAALIAAAVPAVLLLPWLLEAGLDPLLAGPGRLLVSERPAAIDLVLLSPDGRRLLVAGLVVAALAGLLRRTRHRVALAGWALALPALAGAWLLARDDHWPGPALQLAAAGMLLTAVVGADELQARLAQRSFGWRQVVAGVLAAAAALLPLVSAVQWARDGADGPLRRGARPVLPAFAAAELAAAPGLRVLVLRRDGVGGASGVSYDLTGADDNHLGAADSTPPDRQDTQLDAVVADLLTARGSDAAEALSTRAVRYVAVPTGAGSEALAAALDAQAGLTRRTSAGVLLWHVLAPTGGLTVLPPPLAQAALRGERGPTRELLRTDPPRPVGTGREGGTTTVGPGRPGRMLVLAQAADDGWRATFDGAELAPRTAWGWAQAFDLPPGEGVVGISRDDAPRRRLLLAQAAALVVVLVLAGPGGRKRRGLEVVDDAPGATP